MYMCLQILHCKLYAKTVTFSPICIPTSRDLRTTVGQEDRSIILFRLRTITTDSTANQRHGGWFSPRQSDKYPRNDLKMLYRSLCPLFATPYLSERERKREEQREKGNNVIQMLQIINYDHNQRK